MVTVPSSCRSILFLNTVRQLNSPPIMKVVIFYTTLLTLLVASNAWFLDFKSGKKEKSGKLQSVTSGRKIVLVARKCYVPMYRTDGSSDALSASDELQPIASGVVMTDGKQTDVFPQYDVNQGFVVPVQVPGVEAMQSFGMYPPGYGYGAPLQNIQYLQPEVWANQYGTGDASVPVEPYAPTDYTEPVQTEETTTVLADDAAYTTA